MFGPEDVEQLLVGEARGVEVDLEDLGVVAYDTVRGIRGGPARVPDARAYDALEEPEPGIRPPESTGGEGRSLDDARCGQVYGRK